MKVQYTEEEIDRMWAIDMEKRKCASPAFKALMSWMFDLEEYRKVMRLAHLPNPHLKVFKKADGEK